nr:hypothetical protein [Massilia sp. JS1662]
MTTTITFDVSNTATDTLGGRTATSNGPSFSTANTNMDTVPPNLRKANHS